MENEPLLRFAREVHDCLAAERKHQPQPEDMADLADGLRSISLNLTEKRNPPMPEDIESPWAAQMLEMACECIPGSRGTAAQVAAWLNGYAAALLTATFQVLALRRGGEAVEGVTWDQIFIEELGGPDLRIVGDGD